MESERINRPVPAQWLHMLNSSHIQRKLEQGPKLRAIFEQGRKPADTVVELYLTILSRFPTPDEVQNAIAYGNFNTPIMSGKSSKMSKSAATAAWMKRRDDWIDIAWSLINSMEFLYRH
jgi:hypothetical protein